MAYEPTFSELTLVRDPLGNETQFSYTNGLMTSARNALNQVTTFEYDPRRRLTKVELPRSDGHGATPDRSARQRVRARAVSRSFVGLGLVHQVLHSRFAVLAEVT